MSSTNYLLIVYNGGILLKGFEMFQGKGVAPQINRKFTQRVSQETRFF